MIKINLYQKSFLHALRCFVTVLFVLVVQISPLYGETDIGENLDEDEQYSEEVLEMAEKIMNATGVSLPWGIKDEGEIRELISPYDGTSRMDIRSQEHKIGNIWVMLYSNRWGGGIMIVYDMEQEKVIFKDPGISSINGEVKLYHREHVKPGYLFAFETGGRGGTGVYATWFEVYCFDNGQMKKCFGDDLQGYIDSCMGYRKYEYQYEITPDKNNIWQVRKTGKELQRTCPENVDCKECYPRTDGKEMVDKVDTIINLGQ